MFKPVYSNYTKPGIDAEINRGHPLARGLLKCWLFNENRGQILQNIAGTDTGKIISTNKWEAKTQMRGLSFNGSSTEVDGQTPCFISSIPFSVIMWYLPTVIDTTNGNAIFSCGTAQSTDKSLHFRNKGSSGFLFGQYNDDLTVATPDNTNKITFTVGTELGNKVRSVYTNGQYSGGDTAGGVFSGTTQWYIGRNGWSTLNLFNGIIFMVGVYTRVLTQPEIYWLYKEPYAFIIPK